jgi:hypothetical protein
MNNKLIILTGGLMAVILLATGAYITLAPPQEPSGEEQNDAEEYTVSSSSGAHIPKITVDADELEKNTKLSFEVRKKYKYKTTSQRVEQTSYCISKGHCVQVNETRTYNMLFELTVEKIERVAGKECYVVSQETERKFTEGEKREMRGVNGGGMPEVVIEELEKKMNSAVTYFYYDKENGKCLKTLHQSSTGTITTFTEERAEFMQFNPLFSHWMLALHDNFIWEQKINTSASSEEFLEYVVKGKEEIDGRECFTVEITKKYVTNSGGQKYKSQETTIMWVDVKERIMVKSTTKYEGLSISETELINEQ